MLSKAAQELGRKGGQAKSPAKTAAARANAKLPRTRRNKMDDRLHRAVDETAACIETTRSVAGAAERFIETTLADARSRLAMPPDDYQDAYRYPFVVGMYEGLLKQLLIDMAMLRETADKAQAAVKYLGAK